MRIMFTGLVALLIFSAAATNVFTQTTHDIANLKGDYLGQKFPGNNAEIFAPGVVSTENVELNSVFTREGDEFYFTRKESSNIYYIYWMKKSGDKWSLPEIAPFSGKYQDADPYISPDGMKLLFISKRPVSGTGPPHDIWIIEKKEGEWTDPYAPGIPLNTEHNEIFPALTAGNMLYFNSDRPGGYGSRDLYKSELVNGNFTEPENLGPPFSTEFNEGDVLPAPDESFIIFVSAGRPNSYGSGDLYISFRIQDGNWSEPMNLGPEINSDGYDYAPALSHDGKFFFFTRNNDIYWISAAYIENFRPLDRKR